MLVADPIRQGHDWVKILDFGIAKFSDLNLAPASSSSSENGSVMGTPLYMAPEQFGKAEQADGKADVFSLGVVMYELLTGTLPYTRVSLKLLEHSSDTAAERLRGVTPALQALVLRMVSTDAAERPTMAEVEHQLSVLIPTTSSQPPSVVQAGFGLRVQVILGVIVLTILHLVVALIILSRREPSRQEVKTHALGVIQSALVSSDVSLQQKALVAVGQSGDMSHRRLLEPHLQSPHPELATSAARALGRIGAVESQATLLKQISEPHEPSVELALAESLARLHHPEGVRRLTDLLERKSTDPELRFRAAAVLLELGNHSGAALLWEGLLRGNLSELTRLATLSPLALAGDVKAREQLTDSFAHSSQPQGRLFAAFTLARLGDETARKFLVETESTAGPLQILSAQLLATLGDAVGSDLLLLTANNNKEPDAVRELAITGLADCGTERVLAPLDKIITNENDSASLRVIAAGALLHILIDSKSQLAQQSLTWAYVALGSSNASTRELAVAALGQIESDESIPHLRMALRDEAKGVRKTAAYALGRKRVRAALLALAESLDDRDVEVRAVSLRAIRRVRESLYRQGDTAVDAVVLARLAQVSKSGTEPDQVAAAAILLQIGDKSQEARLAASLSSADPLVRKLALEFANSNEEILATALQDGDRGVRFTAAKRLLERGSRRGIAILKEVSQVADVMGLIAYNKLKAIGEDVLPPEGLARVLQGSELQGRLDALDVVAEMPPEQAVALLFLASRDMAGAMRHRVAEIAKEMYQRTGMSALLHLLQSLARDADPLVRSTAVVALSAKGSTSKIPVTPPPDPVVNRKQSVSTIELAKPDMAPANAPQSDAGIVQSSVAVPTVTAAASPSDAGTDPNGQLLIEAGDSVRVQIDHGVAAVVSKKPISLPVGVHRLHYLGGEKEVEVQPGTVSKISIPVTTADQLLFDGKEAFHAAKLDRALESFEKLRSLERRGRIRSGLSPEIAFHLARIYESRGELGRALQEYNRLRSMPAAASEYLSSVDKAMSRLAADVGHIILFRTPNTEGGGCTRDDLYLPPGNHILDVGAGKTELVRVQAGTTVTLSKCR